MSQQTVQPLCRDAEDETRFCQFAGQCQAARQLTHHHYGIRGADCWFYVRMSGQEPVDLERAAIQGEEETT